MQAYLKTYTPAYYRANKAEINLKMARDNKRRRQERYEEIRLLKKGVPCKDCGKTFPPYVMDYHHRDPKAKFLQIPTIVKRMYPWEKVLEEISKCDLLCSCCHRLKTYFGRNTYKSLRFRYHSTILDELKSATPCSDCGHLYKPCQMDFDHLKGSQKISDIARLVGAEQAKLLNEIAKCQLVCSNCHRVRTHGKPPKKAGKGNLHCSTSLVERFQTIASRTPYPRDERTLTHDWLPLVGTMTDSKLATQQGVSTPLISWLRKKYNLPKYSRVQNCEMVSI